MCSLWCGYVEEKGGLRVEIVALAWKKMTPSALSSSHMYRMLLPSVKSFISSCFTSSILSSPPMAPSPISFFSSRSHHSSSLIFSLVSSLPRSKLISPVLEFSTGAEPPLTPTKTDDSSSSSSVIDFLTLCSRLKKTKRTGWSHHDVEGPESIADHMYRMSLMVLACPDLPGINRERCIKMAVVHDIAEAIVGDITPFDGVPKEEKHRREVAALEEMCRVLGGGPRAEEIKKLWEEYEKNSSPEAKMVKDFDKIEMILQALEYEMEQGKDLGLFFRTTAGKFQTDIGKRWAMEIVSRRNSLSDKINRQFHL